MLVVGGETGWVAVPLRADGVFELVGEQIVKPDGSTEWVQVLRPRPDVSIEQYDALVARLRAAKRYGLGGECDDIDTEISAANTRRLAPRRRSTTKRRGPAPEERSAAPTLTVVP